MHRIRALVSVVVVAVVAVSCGGGDEPVAQPAGSDTQEAQPVTQPDEGVTQPAPETTAVWVPLGDRFEWCTDLQAAWERHSTALQAAVTAVTDFTQTAAAASGATDELDRAAALERLDAAEHNAGDVIRTYDATSSDYPQGQGVDFLAAMSEVGDSTRIDGTKAVAYGRASDAFAAAASPEEVALLRHFGDIVFRRGTGEASGVPTPAAVAASIAVANAFDTALVGAASVEPYDLFPGAIGILDALEATIRAPAETLSAAPRGTNLDSVPENTFAGAIEDVGGFLGSANDTNEISERGLWAVYSHLGNGDQAAAAAEADAVMGAFDALEAELAVMVASVDDDFASFTEVGYGYIRYLEGDDYEQAAGLVDAAVVEVNATRAGFDAAVEAALDDIAQARAAFLDAVDDARAAAAAPFDAVETTRRVAAAEGGPAWAAAAEAHAIRVQQEQGPAYVFMDFLVETAAVESLMRSSGWPALQASLVESCQ